MAKVDEIKELIGFLKVLFATFVALDASLIAWLTKVHEEVGLLLGLGTMSLIIVFSAGIIGVVKAILKNIKRLEEL